MLKRLFAFFIVGFVAVFALTACGEEFKTDGVFRAFKAIEKEDGPELATVAVTIKNGKIVDFDIDTIQPVQTESGVAFNEKSKKELGYLYGMHFYQEYCPITGSLYDEEVMEEYIEWMKEEGYLEWFEQAEKIEKHWVEKGIKAAGEGGDMSFVSGVTIVDDNYINVAREAVKFAREGKTQVTVTNGMDLYWVTAKVNKDGKFTELEIDTLQGEGLVDGGFVFRDKSKQELGYLYGMHFQRSGIEGELTDADVMAEYKEWLRDEGELEWFEQVNKLTDYVLANGLTGYEVDDKGKLVVGTEDSVLAGITIVVPQYQAALVKLFNDFK